MNLVGVQFCGVLSFSAMKSSSISMSQIVFSNTGMTCAPKNKCFQNGFSGVHPLWSGEQFSTTEQVLWLLN